MSVRFTFTSLLCLCFFIKVEAQNRVNYWMSGQHAMMYFDNGVQYQYRPDDGDFWRTSASISDAQGNLLFYTNGYRIYNKDFQLLQNGDNLDIGDYVSLGYEQLSVADGAVIVPNPGHPAQYYLFHQDLDLIPLPQGTAYWPSHVFYSLVDMSLDNGQGGVITGQKNIAVLTDTLTQNGMKAIKHGNGRDWWLLCHEYATNRYYRLLVDPDGVHGPYDQQIGIGYEGYNATGASESKFYNDYQSFAQLSRDSNIVELYDFDRCSGLLSSRRTFQLNDPWVPVRGTAISPNDRYLYVSSSFTEILQFDLLASDIAATRTVVGTDDGTGNPFAAHFSSQQLGPDGKIYVQGWDSNYGVHVIHNPNEASTACNFEQWGFALDTSSFSVWMPVTPNAPNYALGPFYGSGCDTVTKASALSAPAFTFFVYPNPFVDELKLSASAVVAKAHLEVSNVLGQLVYDAELQPVNHFVHHAVDMSNYASGVYIITLLVNNQQFVRKVVKK